MADAPEKQPEKLCFVIGAIGEDGSPERVHADWLLEGIINPVFREHFTHFNVVRADKIAQPGMIDSQIINHLLDVELVIADMTFLNANAFYELGIRHMAQKPTVHMFRTGDPIPFDVKPHRAIPFSVLRPQDQAAARAALREAVAEVEKPNFTVENPVTRARGVVQLQQNATPGLQVLMESLDALKERVDTLHQHYSKPFSSTHVAPHGFDAREPRVRIKLKTGEAITDSKIEDIMVVMGNRKLPPFTLNLEEEDIVANFDGRLSGTAMFNAVKELEKLPWASVVTFRS